MHGVWQDGFPKSMPKDVQIMAQTLKDYGDYRIWAKGYQSDVGIYLSSNVITILNDAKIPSSHAKKAAIDAADVQLEIQCPPPINFSLDIERQQNQTLCHWSSHIQALDCHLIDTAFKKNRHLLLQKE